MPRRLLLLFFILFIAMIGFGVTLPALPFFVERLALGDGVAESTVAFHVGALTSAYALTQLACAPLWGWWADQHGRKPLLVVGLGGFALAQAVFGLGTSLSLLYGARLVGGASSASLLTASAAYVSDTLSSARRGVGMAWRGTALNLGVVAGPLLSGLLARRDWHVDLATGHFAFDGFSIPFFAASGLAVVALPLVFVGLPESLRAGEGTPQAAPVVSWREIVRRLGDVLVLVLVSQALLALFEAAFALYAGQVLAFSLAEVGYVFVVCGLVMAVFQGGAAGWLAGRVRTRSQVTIGFGLLGAGLAFLLMVESVSVVLGAVGVLALGVALIDPSLLTLVANRSGLYAGVGLGLQNAAGSLGQVIGPLLGGLLYAWRPGLPFQAAAGGAWALALLVWKAPAAPSSVWAENGSFELSDADRTHDSSSNTESTR
jgi:DHA1 family multidrug resistance protein-like MFS transporter